MHQLEIMNKPNRFLSLTNIILIVCYKTSSGIRLFGECIVFVPVSFTCALGEVVNTVGERAPCKDIKKIEIIIFFTYRECRLSLTKNKLFGIFIRLQQSHLSQRPRCGQ